MHLQNEFEQQLEALLSAVVNDQWFNDLVNYYYYFKLLLPIVWDSYKIDSGTLGRG